MTSKAEDRLQAARDAVANVEITRLRTEIARRINTGTPPF